MKKHNKWVLIIVIVIITANYLKAQIPSYSFEVDHAPYKALQSDTNIAPSRTWDEFSKKNIPMGFTVNVFGQECNQVSIEENKLYFSFKDSGIIVFTPLLPVYDRDGSFYAGRISDKSFIDEGLPPTKAKTQVGYRTSGPIGKRIFTVEFRNCKYQTSRDTTDYLNFQVSIYEEGSILELHQGSYQFHQPDSINYPYTNGPMHIFAIANDGINSDKAYMLHADPKAPSIATSYTFGKPYPVLSRQPEEGVIYRFVPQKASGVQSLPLNNYSTELVIMPNPVQDVIALNRQVHAGTSYVIYNSLGNEVQRGVFSESEKIDVKKLSQGMFFLKVDGIANAISFAK